MAWALAGEPRADDARMLELLEPYRGQRGRVQRLLEVGRIDAAALRAADGAAPHRHHLMRIALATVGTTGDVAAVRDPRRAPSSNAATT